MTKTTNREDSKVSKVSTVSKVKKPLKLGDFNMTVARLKKILHASYDETNEKVKALLKKALCGLGLSPISVHESRKNLPAIEARKKALDDIHTILKKLHYSYDDAFYITVSEKYFTRDEVRIINDILETYERKGVALLGVFRLPV